MAGEAIQAREEIMSSGAEGPQLSEPLKRLKEREDRNRRLARAILVMLLGGVSMVSGAVLIGDQHYDYGWEEFRWHKWQLEASILLTLLGTIIVTVTIVYLLPPFRR